MTWIEIAANIALLLVLGSTTMRAIRGERGAVAAFLRARSGEWVETLELKRVFGVGVSNVLASLKDDGLVERKQEAPTGARHTARAGIPIASYRWIGP